MWYVFKVFSSNKPDIEMWQIFDLYCEKFLPEDRLIAELLLFLRKSGSPKLMALSEFWPEAQN